MPLNKFRGKYKTTLTGLTSNSGSQASSRLSVLPQHHVTLRWSPSRSLRCLFHIFSPPQFPWCVLLHPGSPWMIWLLTSSTENWSSQKKPFTMSIPMSVAAPDIIGLPTCCPQGSDWKPNPPPIYQLPPSLTYLSNLFPQLFPPFPT